MLQSASLALYLQEQGFEITYLPVDAQGRVKMSALEAVLRPDTIMVSTMLVNNEVGAVMPVEEIAKMVHEKSPKALYHVDAIQGFGKYHIYPKRMGIDLLAVSGHKIHGPKGVGFLYINEKVKIIPQYSWWRTAEWHAFRNRQCTGNRRAWCGSRIDLPKSG